MSIFFALLLASAPHAKAKPKPVYFEVDPVEDAGAQKMAPPPTNIDRKRRADAVSVRGAGEFEFDALAAGLAMRDFADGHAIDRGVNLGFDAAGKPVSCDDLWGDTAKVADYCNAIMRSGKFHFQKGFELPASVGFLSVTIRYTHIPDYLAPISFVTEAMDGYSLYLNYRKIARSPISCEIPIYFQLNSTQKTQICSTFITKFGTQLPLSTKMAEIRTANLWLKANTALAGKYQLAEVSTWNDEWDFPLYQPIEVNKNSILSANAGKIPVALLKADYPENYYRYESTNSQVLLGIDPQGAVASCRPIGEGEKSELDNRACVIFLKRGKFEFAPDFPKPDGVRYTRQSITWPPKP